MRGWPGGLFRRRPHPARPALAERRTPILRVPLFIMEAGEAKRVARPHPSPLPQERERGDAPMRRTNVAASVARPDADNHPTSIQNRSRAPSPGGEGWGEGERWFSVCPTTMKRDAPRFCAFPFLSTRSRRREEADSASHTPLHLVTSVATTIETRRVGDRRSGGDASVRSIGRESDLIPSSLPEE